jgi:ankyrin repeat protein
MSEYNTYKLFYACQHGNLTEVKELIRHGNVNINAMDYEQNTPLHIAAQNNHPKIVKELVENDAQLNLQNEYGETPVHKAAINSLESIKELIKAGADVNIQDDWGTVPLHVASHWGHLNIVIELVKAGANTSIKNDDGHTAAQVAGNKNHKNIKKFIDSYTAFFALKIRNHNVSREKEIESDLLKYIVKHYMT